MKKIYVFLFSVAFYFSLSGQNQATDFTFTDLDGNSHSLYSDYLDQGVSVFISIGAAWNPWDSVWLASGVLNDFHNEFAGSEAVVLFLEVAEWTDDASLSGGGQDSTFDLVTGNDFPIINVPTNDVQQMINDYGIAWYPTIRLICPDRSMTGDHIDSDLSYGEFMESEDVADALFLHCGTLFSDKNALIVDVFADENADCAKQSQEDALPGIPVRIEFPGGFILKNTNQNGECRRLLEMGDYDVSAENTNAFWTSCNSPQTVSFPTSGETQELSLGLEALEDCTYVNATVTSPRLRRCFESEVIVDFCNEGTIDANGITIDVYLEPALAYQSASHTLLGQNGQWYTFEIGDIATWECGKLIVKVIPDCDIDLGTSVCYDAKVNGLPACDYGYHFDRECQEIIGAYDPNDKRAFPYHGSDDYKILPDGQIRYQIRFQNTGTDTAFNIVVEDVMSEFLDLGTFRKLSSSHPCYEEIEDNGMVRFYFDNIMLPDSNVNIEGSNGYINFTIDLVDGLSNGTIIENDAGIYFDFNDPIITNTTSHEVDDGISNNNEIELLEFVVSPNPVTAIATINLKESNKKHYYSFFDLQGRILKSGSWQGNSQEMLDFGDYDNGVYILRLNDENGIRSSQRIVKL